MHFCKPSRCEFCTLNEAKNAKMKYTLKNKQIAEYNESNSSNLPKYTSQLMNLANQNAQGTRPKIVGQMSELFSEFTASEKDITVENWRKWYTERYPNTFEEATNRIYAQIQNLENAMPLISREMVKQWVEELIINKTFNGLYVQKAILAFLAEQEGTTYRLATPEEESVGIDGYVGNVPYSIKPDTYKRMQGLPETIEIKKIYYSKIKTGLNIEVEES